MQRIVNEERETSDETCYMRRICMLCGHFHTHDTNPSKCENCNRSFD